jgi:hypothetical protein
LYVKFQAAAKFARSAKCVYLESLTTAGICSYFVLMPEPSGRQKPSAWTLSKAHGAGQLVRVRCGHCNITRHYQPADLQRLAGDVPADGIRMRCEKCGKSGWMRVSFESLPAAERQAIRVRRLAEVRTVRKVIWRDETE